MINFILILLVLKNRYNIIISIINKFFKRVIIIISKDI